MEERSIWRPTGCSARRSWLDDRIIGGNGDIGRSRTDRRHTGNSLTVYADLAELVSLAREVDVDLSRETVRS